MVLWDLRWLEIMRRARDAAATAPAGSHLSLLLRVLPQGVQCLESGAEQSWPAARLGSLRDCFNYVARVVSAGRRISSERKPLVVEVSHGEAKDRG